MLNNPLIFACKIKLLLIVIGLAFCQLPFATTLDLNPQIKLCTGEVKFSKFDKTARVNDSLVAGDTVQTLSPLNSRCRIVFPSGNAIHMGPMTTLKIEHDQQIKLITGEIVAYAMPRGENQQQSIKIQIGQGVLDLSMGKIMASSVANKFQVAIFNDLVAAVWHDSQGEQILYPGNLVNISSAGIQIAAISPKLEDVVSERTSPELPALNLATQAFQEKDLPKAKRLFTQIQQAFPYNGPTAYYLGLFALNDNKTAEAVQQWQLYAQIDPEGAKKNGVTKQLTLMTSKTIQDEVKQAIARENSISTLAPEPNSIAVNPLINKGEEQYQAIGKGLTAFIITDLAKVPGLKVLEREKLQTLIDELKLSEQNGLVQKNTQIRAGHLMRAETLMIGDYLIGPKQAKP